ncbi:MAG: enoyl-CoA hydratase/isomerase family protein [Betaproteobacteria bacterium]|nr:enoyl-CoA hydratase/isomerase family protein [Betaproteobacteria bacterium]
MSDSPVLYQVDGAVATITLNRPDVLNALNTALMLALREAVEKAAADAAIRAVVVTGAGRGFSAGADLASSSGGTGNAGTTLRERYHPVILAMRAMPKPIISAVNGVAAGAGMSIAMAGDIILAGRSASFLQAFSKIGLVPDAGSTWFLPRYVGDVRARAMAILADRISAQDAQAFGLVWQVHEDAELLPKAQEMAQRLAAMPTRAYAMIKQALNDSHQRDLATQLELEADLQVEAGKTEDFREGVAAFLQKRPPQFKGR